MGENFKNVKIQNGKEFKNFKMENVKKNSKIKTLDFAIFLNSFQVLRLKAASLMNAGITTTEAVASTREACTKVQQWLQVMSCKAKIREKKKKGNLEPAKMKIFKKLKLKFFFRFSGRRSRLKESFSA